MGEKAEPQVQANWESEQILYQKLGLFFSEMMGEVLCLPAEGTPIKICPFLFLLSIEVIVRIIIIILSENLTVGLFL